MEHTKVDMFEALPVPFGLVRFGVAPDHPEVKVCLCHVTMQAATAATAAAAAETRPNGDRLTGDIR